MFDPKAGARGRQSFLVWANPQELWLVTNIGESEIAAVRGGSKARGTMPQAQAIAQGQTFAMPRAALAFSRWCRFRYGCGASR
jgi:hypothetical protein